MENFNQNKELIDNFNKYKDFVRKFKQKNVYPINIAREKIILPLNEDFKIDFEVGLN